jgi:hypothetical protein
MQTYEQYAGYETRDGADDGSAECSFCERRFEWNDWVNTPGGPVCEGCFALYWCGACGELSTLDDHCVHVARKVSILTANGRELKQMKIGPRLCPECSPGMQCGLKLTNWSRPKVRAPRRGLAG